MAYNKGRKKFHKRKKRKFEDPPGLAVTVYDNNVEFALKRFKKKVKNSNLMLELKKKAYYEKPSKLRRERRNLAKLRNKYKNLKENPKF
jgi:ribosomal protein S21